MKLQLGRWVVVGSCVVGLGVAGCSTVNPYTGEKQTAKATSGALIGGVTGAVIGAATGDKEHRKQRVLKGAGIGAIAGGGVGYYMDVQEAKLREKLQNTGVSVTRNGDNIILNMPSAITFDVNSAGLKPDFFSALDSVNLVLKEYESTLVTVAGHTDSTGAADHNMALSQQRAQTVAQYLQNHGVVAERLAAVGYGETHPVASNETADGKARNRRVEITLDPITKQ
ncbi:MAG: OmpA family protein [Gammaproteobacteria bacterium]|nr:OmpA family protein [Gammaproteobacteria bacterium]